MTLGVGLLASIGLRFEVEFLSFGFLSLEFGLRFYYNYSYCFSSRARAPTSTQIECTKAEA